MNKKIIYIITTCLIACLAFSGGFLFKDYYVHHDPAVTANVAFYEGTGADARLVATSGNLITDFGENRTLYSLLNTLTSITGMAVGNITSVDASDTGLDTEATTAGFTRVACNVSSVWSNGGDSAVNFTASWDASAAIAVNGVALCLGTSASAADAVALSFITDGTMHQFPLSTPASRLTAVWTLTCNAN